MIRDDRLRLLLLPTLCLSLLIASVGGIHLHLCFDGQEPSSSVHTVDAGIHHDTGPAIGATPLDRDLALTRDLVIRSGKSPLDLPAFLLAELLPRLASQASLQFAPADDASLPPLPLYLRPPLRGPPALSSD